jgi:hypothetical protein
MRFLADREMKSLVKIRAHTSASSSTRFTIADIVAVVDLFFGIPAKRDLRQAGSAKYDTPRRQQAVQGRTRSEMQ